MDNAAAGERPEALAELARLQRLFADSIPLVDAETSVAWCGGWTVGDLVDHLTSVHRWAAAMARDQDQEPPAATQDRHES
ncbi:MAG TPA: maleylpyruvate isomerase N-terminal domain-containing protein, partial [Microlunatus sp.]|nr:maleylpyruvate isomerase N-terminal domain-containing protein [Microlunatus sp.]